MSPSVHETQILNIEKGVVESVPFEELQRLFANGSISPLTEVRDRVLTKGEWISANNLKLFHKLNPNKCPIGPILEKQISDENIISEKIKEDLSRCQEYVKYFPNQIFGDDIRQILYRMRPIISLLKSANLTPLRALTSEYSEAYRFIYLPSFDSGIIASIYKNSSSIMAQTGDFYDAIGCDKMQKLNTVINSVNFWTLPCRSDRLGLDGATWLIEGINNGSYHAIYRWSPDVSSGEYLLGETILKTCNLKFKY